MRITINSIAFLLVVFVFNSCKTDPPYYKKGLMGFFQKHHPEGQVNRVDAERDTSLVLDQGTVVKVPANAFLYGNETVTGKVDITIEEYYKRSDMMLGNLHSMYNGGLMSTGGMFYLEASQSGKRLRLDPDKQLELRLPADTLRSGMEVFQGTPAGITTPTSSTFNGPGVGNWWLDSLFWVNNQVRLDTAPLSYVMTINTLGWINCDDIIYTGNEVPLHLTSGNIEANYLDMVFYVFFKNLDGIMRVYDYPNPDGYFSLGRVPADEPVTILGLSISEEGEQFLASKEHIVNATDTILAINFYSATEDEILATIRALDE